MVEKTLSEVAKQIALRSHYENWIGGKWVRAGQGPDVRQRLANQWTRRQHPRPVDRGGHRARARRRA